MGRKKLEKLWLSLLQDPQNLSNKQIEDLFRARKKLGNILFQLCGNFPQKMEEVKNYRIRKKELSQLPTKGLWEMNKRIQESRNRIMNSTPKEKIPDSFFETPPLDYDETILAELLRERGAP